MIHKEFNAIVSRNLKIWRKLTERLANERLAKKLRNGELTVSKLKHDVIAAH